MIIISVLEVMKQARGGGLVALVSIGLGFTSGVSDITAGLSPVSCPWDSVQLPPWRPDVKLKNPDSDYLPWAIYTVPIDLL